MTEGHPGVRRVQRPHRLGRRRLRRLRAGGGCDVRLQWLAVRRRRGAPRRSPMAGPRRKHYLAELGEGRARGLREAAARPRPRPGRLPLPARCTPGSGTNRLAGDLRARRRPAAPRAARRGADDAPGAAVDPHVLPGRPPGAVLREGRPGDPEHGLPARALAGLHGAPRRRSTTGSPSSSAGDEELRGLRLLGAPGARRDRLDRRRLPPARRRPRPYRKMVAALWRESPVPRLGRRRAAGDDGVAAAPGPRRRAAGRRADRAPPAWRREEWVRDLPPRLPPPARALPARPRPRVHAARREPRHGAARPRPDPDGDEGHRRGGRGADRPPAARRGRAHPAASSRPTCAALAIHTDVFDGFLRHLGGILSGVRAAGEPPLLGPGPATASPATSPTTRSWPRQRRPTTCCAREFAPQLPQPAAAAQHAADGRPRRPGRVAHLRGHAGQPGRRRR